MKTIVPGAMVIYAGSKYEVAEVRKFPHGLMVGIYDEPPSKHIDWLNWGSVVLLDEDIYWAIEDEDGHIDHTSIMSTEEECRKDFCERESLFVGLAAGRRGGKAFIQSWETFEAQGYDSVPIRIVRVDGAKINGSPK